MPFPGKQNSAIDIEYFDAYVCCAQGKVKSWYMRKKGNVHKVGLLLKGRH